MANGLDYYTQPANPMQGLQMFSEKLGQRREKREGIAKQEEFANVIQTGTPEEIQSYVASTPGGTKMLNDFTKSIDSREKQQTLSSARRVLILGENATEVLREDAQNKIENGEDATGELKDLQAAMSNPEMSTKQAETALMLLDPSGYKVYMSQKAGGSSRLTANIQDFNHYQELLNTDPEGAEKFAKMTGITPKQEKLLKPTTAEQNFEAYKNMPAGKEKDNFGRTIGIKPGVSEADSLKKAKEKEAITTEIVGAETTIGLVDTLLTTPRYIDNIAGITGVVPSRPGSDAYDSEIVFDQLESMLTLENLGKMKGVLTDKDIAILRSAAAGFKRGMSKEALVKRLTQVKDILSKKANSKKEMYGITDEVEEGQEENPMVTSQAEFDALPSGTVFIEDGKKYRKP